MKLNFSSFEKAVESLQRAVKRSLKVPRDTEVRDSVIQRFEYTYELACKMLRRTLEQRADDPERVSRLSYRDLLREAGEQGIRMPFKKWLNYREQRNITSHVYDERKAKKVHRAAVLFLNDAKKLLLQLEEIS